MHTILENTAEADVRDTLAATLTIAETAAALRVHPGTVRRWIRSGELTAYRLGRGRRVSIRISPAAIDAFLQPTRLEGDEAHATP